ncbi:MAG: carboxypeptidase-like regulatory domain-containing protein [Planctomycetota bacterium]|nr:carboxypeptidase-like regulatory domain-containing protein [Planctomycetota bacterium]
MRSAKVKRTKALAPALGFASIAIVVLGAYWLLTSDDSRPLESSHVVQSIPDKGADPMVVPEVPVQGLQPKQMDIPATELSTSASKRYVAASDTPRRRISGRILNEKNEGVPDCKVTIYKGNPMLMSVNFAGSRQFLGIDATSGPDGSFEMSEVPIGRDYVLVGEHPDYAQTELMGLHLQAKRDLTGVILRMEGGATVEGAVTSIHGGPIEGARVELFDAIATVQLPPEQRRPWKIVFTDINGDYAFDHVSATSLKVRVLAQDYESQSRMLSFALDARASDRTVDFELKDGMSLPGRVVDEQGRGIPNVRIEATSLTKDYQGTAIAQSDRSGTFLLDGMGDQNYYQLRATATGYSNKIEPKVHTDEGELLIQMEKRLLVEGQVVDHTGAPIRSYTLTLMRAAKNRDPLTLNDTRNFSSPDGRFVFDNLDPGDYALEARAKGLAPSWSESFAILRQDEPPQPLVITLGRGGTLRGSVRNSRGESVPGAVIRLNPNNYLNTLHVIFSHLSDVKEPGFKTKTDENGAFVLSNIRAGVYQIAATDTGSAPVTVNDVSIVDDETGTNAPLNIKLPAGSAIAGLARDSNSQVIPFCEIQIHNKKSAFLGSATTDAFGRFNFDNLAEGTYTLMIKPDRIGSKHINPLMKLMYAQRSEREIFVAAGQTVSDVELYLPPIEQTN